MRPSFIVAGLLLVSFTAAAQLAVPDPDWKELEAPPPPALRTQGLIPLEVRGTTLQFGVDPQSVALGGDGVVRYVVVATSTTGTVNALYEGVRCGTGEVKVYARHNPDSGWVPARGADWQPLREGPQARHSLLIARTGACVGDAPNRNASQIVRDLRAPVDRRFHIN
jgi:hypothetical protein